jgi:signal transduction histidine kinase
MQTSTCAIALLDEPRDGVTSEVKLGSAVRRIVHILARSTTEGALAHISDPLDVALLRDTLNAALRHERRRREFAYVAHELRSPLSSIRGYLELLEPHDSVSAQAEFVKAAQGEALRLGRLLEAMSEISMLDGEALRKTGTCNVSTIVQSAVDATRPRALARNVRVSIIRRTRVPARVEADDCVRASINILQNAIDAGARVITVSSSSARGRVRIAFDDDGPGVETNERRAIFNREIRGHAATRYPGSGLGLAVVSDVARAYGGSVSVRASMLGGARFVMTFGRFVDRCGLDYGRTASP